MLDVSGLSAGYDGRAVVHELSLSVGPGEIVALLGANGSGKSTMARTLSGLLPALRGSIRLQGADITKASPAARVAAGLVHIPEGRQLFAGLTVMQNLELGAYLGATGQDRSGLLEKMFERFPILRERATGVAGNLSGGQQQMLAIARGLMGQPKLLILDEPSLGLAPSLVAGVFALIADLRAQGLSILLSEQNARMSLAIADRAYVLENGRITLSGPSADLAGSSDVAARYLGLGAAAETEAADGGMAARLRSIMLDTPGERSV